MDMGAGTNLNYKLLAFGWANAVYEYNNCVHRAAIILYLLQHGIHN